MGLILVDTKYEFGMYNGELIVIDEIHTPDSSRYWIKESYDENFKKGLPKILIKKILDNGLLNKVLKDGTPPKSDDINSIIGKVYGII